MRGFPSAASPTFDSTTTRVLLTHTFLLHIMTHTQLTQCARSIKYSYETEKRHSFSGKFSIFYFSSDASALCFRRQDPFSRI